MGFSVKNSEKDFIKNVVAKILDKTVNQEDMKNLLIRLREFSVGEPIFQEISHFVAHGLIRDRGLIKDSMLSYDLRLKYNNEYYHTNKELDLTFFNPIWILDYIGLQAVIHKKELHDNLKMTPSGFSKKLKTIFEINNQKTLFRARNGHISREYFHYIQHIVAHYGTTPAFTGAEIMESFLRVLKKNDLNKEADSLIGEDATILGCLLVVMHSTKFKPKPGCVADVNIASRWQFRESIKALDNNGKYIIDENLLGNLTLSASIKGGITDIELGELPEGMHAMSYPVISVEIPTLRMIAEDCIYYFNTEDEMWENLRRFTPEASYPLSNDGSLLGVGTNFDGELKFENGLICKYDKYSNNQTPAPLQWRVRLSY
jgi:hypothetical protein